jgi:thiol-disulfide isomerase/thioredoxin
MRGSIMFIQLFAIVTMIGCGGEAVKQEAPVVVPQYVDQVTTTVEAASAKTIQRVDEVKVAIEENTQVLRELKAIVETPAGEADAPRTPSNEERLASPALRYWETGEVYVQYFGATWCGPCRTAKPGVQKLCEQYGLKLTEFDYDSQQSDFDYGGIASLPTIVLCSKNTQIARMEGWSTADAFEQFLQKNGLSKP